ncbi:hypothetical protein [Enterococcus lemanii]|uniref:Uncharacterized protein n=1 Tax=Enterococcus lemanii TaxID=1159752 RepID=A0ABV9MV60_9ENTE|nr:hypothetical protein [Enterococcus lemanii]MBM7709337.1 hypothetical protein [Enterococcus lemanii]
MKKKKLAKLKQQFRPSFKNAQQMLLTEMEKQALILFEMPIKAYIKPTNQQEVALEYLGQTTRDSIVTMPIDENFINLIKQIQALEKGVLERSSKNLITDVASYWLSEPQTTVKENSKTEDKKQVEPLLETVTTDIDDTDNSTPEADALALFKEQMAAFPKFFVVEETGTIKLIEKTAKEERLLATISSVTPNTFTIETALERKYKLKLEVIPLIEAFAKTIA